MWYVSYVDEKLCFSKNIGVKVCDSYASTKVSIYAMKLYPTYGALFGVSYA